MLDIFIDILNQMQKSTVASMIRLMETGIGLVAAPPTTKRIATTGTPPVRKVHGLDDKGLPYTDYH